jgi:hypothetical protein
MPLLHSLRLVRSCALVCVLCQLSAVKACRTGVAAAFDQPQCCVTIWYSSAIKMRGVMQTHCKLQWELVVLHPGNKLKCHSSASGCRPHVVQHDIVQLEHL